MTWTIDPPVRVGRRIFAAIVQVDVSINSRALGVTGSGQKKPRLILQVHAGQITAVDISGAGYSAEEIEALYPDAIGQLRTLLSETA